MTQREQSLLRLLIILGVGIVGLFVLFQWFLGPLQTYNRTIARLQDEVTAKEDQVQTIVREKRQLALWRLMGLPADPHAAALEYAQFLRPLLEDSGLTVNSFQANVAERKTSAGNTKKPSYLPITFTIDARGRLDALVRALDRFEKTPVLHRVRNLTIRKPETGSTKGPDRGLAFQMMVEALIVNGTTNKSLDLKGRGETIAAVERPSRSYGDLARKDIFEGAPPPVIVEEPRIDPAEDRRLLERVLLASITHADRETQRFRNHEAFLRIYYYKAPDIRLCPTAGFDTFRIRAEDSSRVVAGGKVLRIDPRDVFFESNEKIYRIHIGESLAEALERPLSRGEIEALGLGPSGGEDTGKLDKQEQVGRRTR